VTTSADFCVYLRDRWRFYHHVGRPMRPQIICGVKAHCATSGQVLLRRPLERPRSPLA
jgi:hypothetical protein